jgi:hypothetical protein
LATTSRPALRNSFSTLNSSPTMPRNRPLHIRWTISLTDRLDMAPLESSGKFTFNYVFPMERNEFDHQPHSGFWHTPLLCYKISLGKCVKYTYHTHWNYLLIDTYKYTLALKCYPLVRHSRLCCTEYPFILKISDIICATQSPNIYLCYCYYFTIVSYELFKMRFHII